MLEKINAFLEEANHKFDVTNAKIDVYTESVLGQFEINCKKAELKVLTESGSMEDLHYLEEQAEGGAMEGIKKAIDKIIETFVNFVNEIKLKILTLIAKKETKKTIDDMEKKIKFNPFLSNKSVQIENTQKQLKVVAWANAELAKLISKIKSGKEVAVEEADKIFNEFKARMKSASGVESAVKTKLRDAASMLHKAGDNMADQIDKFSKITKELINDAKASAGELHKNAATTLKNIASKASAVGKEAITAIVNFWKSTVSVIRSAVSKIKDKPESDETTNESTVDSELTSLEDEIMESVGDSILNDIEKELFGESAEESEDVVEESFEDDFEDFMKLLEEDVLN